MFENQKIKEVRERLGLTQQEVADKLGVSKQYFSKVETGQTHLSKDKLKLFCETYKISFDWMFGSAPNMFQQQENFIRQICTDDDGNDYFGHLIEVYNAFIIYIKAFIEKKYPDATFENKLNTACIMFHIYLGKGELPLSGTKTENWLKGRLKNNDFQNEVLEMYYHCCRDY